MRRRIQETGDRRQGERRQGERNDGMREDWSTGVVEYWRTGKRRIQEGGCMPKAKAVFRCYIVSVAI
jgi:hypothetical protein